jgi:hypothetical protein
MTVEGELFGESSVHEVVTAENISSEARSEE